MKDVTGGGQAWCVGLARHLLELVPREHPDLWRCAAIWSRLGICGATQVADLKDRQERHLANHPMKPLAK
jgi:hypothetical protein